MPARTSRNQESKLQEEARLDEVLPLIQRARDKGITVSEIKEKVLGESKSQTKLTAKLKALIKEQAIRGPVKYANQQYYFADGQGPTAETVSADVARIAQRLGSKPPSAAILKKEVKGIREVFLKEAIKLAVDSRAVLELQCGKTPYYLHRDAAAKHFGEFATPATRVISGKDKDLVLEDVLPAYRDLKAKQRGLSTVLIYDLLKKLQVSKDALHRLLKKERQSEGVVLHHATIPLPDEVMDAAIWIDGIEEPYVSVVVNRER